METKKAPVSPLSLPLDKVTPHHIETKKGAPKDKSKKEAGKSDNKIKLITQPVKLGPSTISIVLMIVLAPFIFRAGSDLYDITKPQALDFLASQGIVSKVERPQEAGSKDTSNDKELIKSLASQNRKVVKQLSKSMAARDKAVLKKLDKLIELQEKFVQARIATPKVAKLKAQGKFSFKEEKKKLFKLAGLDLDDPITKTNAIEKIKSVPLLQKMTEHFDRILLNASEHGISDFHIQNAIVGKRKALNRLKELK